MVEAQEPNLRPLTENLSLARKNGPLPDDSTSAGDRDRASHLSNAGAGPGTTIPTEEQWHRIMDRFRDLEIRLRKLESFVKEVAKW